jgi:uncharacterized protein
VAGMAGRVWAAGVTPPRPGTPVLDEAHVLTPLVARGLENDLRAFRDQTSNEIQVAIYPHVPGGEVMEDFTVRTAHAWQIGQKGRDNGIVLFVFPADRKLRIEVGYGLEGAVPDALANRIIANEITPAFKRGDYAGGIRSGVTALMAASRGEYKGIKKNQGPPALFCVGSALTVIFFLIVMGALFGRRSGRQYSSSGSGWLYGGMMVLNALSSGSRSSGRGGGWSGGGGGGGGFGSGGGFGGGGASGSW